MSSSTILAQRQQLRSPLTAPRTRRLPASGVNIPAAGVHFCIEACQQFAPACRLVPVLFRMLGWVLAKLAIFPHIAGSADRAACWIHRWVVQSPALHCIPSSAPTSMSSSQAGSNQ